MQLIGWMYDIAREQAPSDELLEHLIARSRAAGYNALGLYLEHRFAYPSQPWAAGPGCLTPERVRRLAGRARAEGIRLIPFLNTLGHLEGFIRAEGGQHLAERGDSAALSLQICPSRPECRTFARHLVADALAAFDDEWVHLGGDETRQLGECSICAGRVAEVGKGRLYGEYFGELCRWVLAQGRRPCLWGDMLLAHPEALAALPRETLIFDWQYSQSPSASTAELRAGGFDVVCCPSLQTYNAAWCFLRESQENIDSHAAVAQDSGALGVLVTTWEHTAFSQYAATFPLVWAAGERLSAGAQWEAALERAGGRGTGRAAAILGQEVPSLSAFMKPGTWRTLREGLVMNPFLLWRDWRSEACGETGDRILLLLEQAQRGLLGDHSFHFPIELLRVAVEWVRLVEAARGAYALQRPSGAADLLLAAAELVNELRPGVQRSAQAGGAMADEARLDILLEKIDRVRARIIAIGREKGYRPAFETLISDSFVPGDQAAWPVRSA